MICILSHFYIDFNGFLSEIQVIFLEMIDNNLEIYGHKTQYQFSKISLNFV